MHFYDLSTSKIVTEMTEYFGLNVPKSKFESTQEDTTDQFTTEELCRRCDEERHTSSYVHLCAGSLAGTFTLSLYTKVSVRCT